MVIYALASPTHSLLELWREWGQGYLSCCGIYLSLVTTSFSCLVILWIPSVVLSAFLKWALCLFNPCLSKWRSLEYCSVFVAAGMSGSFSSDGRGFVLVLEEKGDLTGSDGSWIEEYSRLSLVGVAIGTTFAAVSMETWTAVKITSSSRLLFAESAHPDGARRRVC